MNEGEILLLERSANVRTNKGKWSVVSGEMEPEGIIETAYAEIAQETGIERYELKLLRRGKELKLRLRPDSETTVYPLLFESTTRRINLNEEHTQYLWTKPEGAVNFDTVPQFRELLSNLDLCP